MLEDIKEGSFEDYDKEKQEMINRKEHSLLGAYTSYSQFKVGFPGDEELVEEVEEKIEEEEVQPLSVFEVNAKIPQEGTVQLTAEQSDAYIKNILLRALKYNATDIHIDQISGLARVRYRVDGKLVMDSSGYVITHSVLSQRFKVMAEFFMREKAIIQKGFVSYYLSPDKKIEFSVMVMPTSDSELMVIKLSNNRSKLKFTDIGMSSEDLRTLGTIFEKQSGLVVISGLSGTGRTTTLYALLNKIISKENNVLTIEKKIFEKINGICQMSVGELPDITLKEILKNINDFDIDVLVVDSEIDSDSVKILLNIALSGKLVILTSYFPTVYDTIVGLISMGVEPYTIAAAMEGVIAQQLVRKICVTCYKNKKTGKPVSKDCPVCAGSVYKGKTGVFEVFKMRREYWSIILKKDDSDKLKIMLENEKCSFESNCKRLVKSGVTSVEEVLRLGIGKGIIE